MVCAVKIVNRILEDNEIVMAASEELEQSLTISFKNLMRFLLKKSFEVIGADLRVAS
jgi:hypothetical protein